MRPSVKQIRFAEIFCRHHQKDLRKSGHSRPELDETIALLGRIVRMNMRDLKIAIENDLAPLQERHMESVLNAVNSLIDRKNDPQLVQLAKSIATSFRQLKDKRLNAKAA